jgi:hypothetical protein
MSGGVRKKLARSGSIADIVGHEPQPPVPPEPGPEEAYAKKATEEAYAKKQAFLAFGNYTDEVDLDVQQCSHFMSRARRLTCHTRARSSPAAARAERAHQESDAVENGQRERDVARQAGS